MDKLIQIGEKLLELLKKLITLDVLELVSFYLNIAAHIVMLAFIVWLFKWFLYVTC